MRERFNYPNRIDGDGNGEKEQIHPFISTVRTTVLIFGKIKLEVCLNLRNLYTDPPGGADN